LDSNANHHFLPLHLRLLSRGRIGLRVVQMCLLLLLAFVTVSALGAAGSNLGIHTTHAIAPGGGGGPTCYDYYFSQTGIPSSVPWTVTVAGFPITYQGSFSECLTENPASYTYDSYTAGPSGTQYVCETGCSGSLTPEDNYAHATYGLQYIVTFSTPTNLGSDATGTVLAVNSSVHGYSDFPLSVGVWPDSGTTFSFASSIPGATGVQYLFESLTGGNSPLTGLTSEVTITASYQPQYHLTVSSTFGSPTGSDWYDSGATAAFSVTTPVSGGAGTQYNFSGWSSGDSGGYTGPLSSQSVTMDNPITETGSWTTQYWVQYQATSCVLPVTAPEGQWVDTGSPATGTFPSPVTNGAGTRCLFVSDNRPSSITAPITVTATYKTQYYLTVNSAYGSPRGQGWYDSGASATYNVTTPWAGGTGVQYIFSSWAGSGTGSYSGFTDYESVAMNNPITETTSWTTQYNVTYAQTGCVLPVMLPSSEWVNSSGSATGTFSTTIAGSGTRCLFVSDNRPSSITAPVTITATYQTQYYLTVNSARGFPTGQGWYDAGAEASSSVTSPVYFAAGRYVATGFTGTGSPPAGGFGTSISFLITQPSSVTWAWKTQYRLTVNESPSFGGSASVIADFFDPGTPVSVTATPKSGYLFSGWTTTGVSCGTGTAFNICAVTMPNGPASVTADFSSFKQALMGTTIQVMTLQFNRGLTQAQADSLAAKLQMAIVDLNSGNKAMACGQLSAFVLQVREFVSMGLLTQRQASILLGGPLGVNAVMASIPC